MTLCLNNIIGIAIDGLYHISYMIETLLMVLLLQLLNKKGGFIMIPTRRTQNWLPSIFNDFFGNEWLSNVNRSSPAINIIESENEYKVEVVTPGMTKEDCNVKIDDNNNLVISMEKKSEKKEGEKDGKYLRQEFSHTQFRQTMILPENIERNKIEAKVEHGVLNIHIPKKTAEEVKLSGRAIDVK